MAMRVEGARVSGLGSGAPSKTRESLDCAI